MKICLRKLDSLLTVVYSVPEEMIAETVVDAINIAAAVGMKEPFQKKIFSFAASHF